MKHKDWVVAGICILLGLGALVVASVGIIPAWWNMGLMMLWVMFLPWIIFIALIMFFLSLGRWVYLKARDISVSNSYKCPVCGARVQFTRKKCPDCGADLSSRPR